MLSRRIIPCLDVRDGRVVKGVRFRDHVDMGDIVELALRYRDEGADELVFYDITASPQDRSVDRAWIERVARVIDIPFCVAGGISSIEDARTVLHAGADKISVNTPALRRPALIAELAEAFGTQCVVVGVDSLRDEDGEWRVRQYTGDPSRTQALAKRTLDWIVEAQELGAGEIVLNCMDSDGVRSGYDLAQLREVRTVCEVPLIASGGAGAISHFTDVFREADVDGALAASVFHSGAIAIPDLKRELLARGVAIRSIATLKEATAQQCCHPQRSEGPAVAFPHVIQVPRCARDDGIKAPDTMTRAQIEGLAWDKQNDLLPAVVQDAATLRVLMLGYMNREALQTTLETRRVTFYSRSKQRLWTKGESSGHYLELVRLESDCDNDTLLVQARPQGPTCHLGRSSCFEHAPDNFLAGLDALIDQRHRDRPQDSYTTRLFDGGIRGIAQKVGEEGVETTLAAVAQDDAALCGEAADLLFHLQVLLRARGLSLDDAVAVLRRRHRG